MIFSNNLKNVVFLSFFCGLSVFCRNFLSVVGFFKKIVVFCNTILEGTSPNLMKKTAVKAIDFDNPGFEKIFKSSENLNGSLTGKFF